MNNEWDDERLNGLFASARNSRPYDTGLEYGFETRVMAKIQEQRNTRKPLFLWAWRLMPAMAAAVMMLSAWTYATERGQLIGLSSITGLNNEETMMVASLTGE